MTNLSKTPPYLQINKFTNSLTDQRSSVGEQGLVRLLCIYTEWPDFLWIFFLFISMNLFKLRASDKVYRQNKGELKSCKTWSEMEKLQTFTDFIDREQNFHFFLASCVLRNRLLSCCAKITVTLLLYILMFNMIDFSSRTKQFFSPCEYWS